MPTQYPEKTSRQAHFPVARAFAMCECVSIAKVASERKDKMNRAAAAIAEKFAAMPLDQVKEVAAMAAARMDDEGDILLGYALMHLELRMDEAEFIALCDTFA